MPRCQECRAWYPTKSDDNDKDFLDVAYHEFECSVREMDDWEGDLSCFIFDGDIMFEVQVDGSMVPVSTYSKYPEPYAGSLGIISAPEEITQEMPTIKDNPAVPMTKDGVAIKSYSWEEWKTKFPHYSRTVENDINPGTTPYRSYTGNQYTWKPPWEGIDRKKWPNLWLFYVKFHFLPNSYKDSKWEQQTEYPYGMGEN